MVGQQLAAQLAHRTPFRCGRRDPAQASNSVRFDFLDSLSFRLALCDFDRVFLLRPPRLNRIRNDLSAEMRHRLPSLPPVVPPCGNRWLKARLAANKTVTAKA